MSKKHKKRKPSRKARRGQPQAAPVDQATAAPAPAEPAQPESAPERPAQQPPQPTVTATFKPAPAVAAPAQTPTATTESEETEYASVRKDLRKLGITIVTFIVVVIGLAILNDQTGFVGTLGEQLFRLWQ